MSLRDKQRAKRKRKRQQSPEAKVQKRKVQHLEELQQDIRRLELLLKAGKTLTEDPAARMGIVSFYSEAVVDEAICVYENPEVIDEVRDELAALEQEAGGPHLKRWCPTSARVWQMWVL